MTTLKMGKPSIKTMYGKDIKVTPYVGDDPDYLSKMGFGLFAPDGVLDRHYFGPVVPHSFIRAWRAMKILEAAEAVELGTLRGCWYASVPDRAFGMQPVIYDLAVSSFSTTAKFDAVRAEALSAWPNASTLEVALRVAIVSDIEVDAAELRQMVKDGVIEEPPALKLLRR